MAKIRFTNRGNDAFKAKYVEKQVYKKVVLVLGCVLVLLAKATYRLYVLNDFNGTLNKITTYYTVIEHFVKGLF